MENSNELKNKLKRLKIVKYVLLLILIIEVIVSAIVMTNRSQQDRISNNTMEVEVYNYTFTVYGGIQRGSHVKALCNTVRNHNIEAQCVSELIVIKEGPVKEEVAALTENDDLYETTNEYIESIKDKIKSGSKYNINFGYDPNTGYITTIGIEEIIEEEGENTNEV